MIKRKEQKIVTKVEEEIDKPQKRGITYEIEKNKGLTVKRKKRIQKSTCTSS